MPLKLLAQRRLHMAERVADANIKQAQFKARKASPCDQETFSFATQST